MIPLTILGGYLGAGKTTLVNALLRRADGRRIAVLVNDFGDLPIDADLIEAEDGDLVSLTGGCVCCSYGDDLMGAVGTLAALDPPPDVLLLEASGVALPGAIAATASLIGSVRVTGVTVLADAETVVARAADRWMGDTVTRQIDAADLLLLTKGDLVDPEPARAWLRARCPGVPVLDCVDGAVPPGAILDLPARRSQDAGTGHSVPLATEVLDGTGPAEALASRLAADAAVLRAKGHVRDADGMRLIQVVGARAEVRPAPPDATPGLVVIRLPG